MERIRKNKEELEGLREKLEVNRNNNELTTVAHFLEAHKEYNKVLIREDTYGRQRARMHWLCDNDLNKKFFHRSAMVRRNFQKLNMLKNGAGEETRDQDGMCGISKMYFDKLCEVKACVYEPV